MAKNQILLVFGYVRNTESTMKRSPCVLFQNIPGSLWSIIYYYFANYYFEIAGADIVISDDQRFITKHAQLNSGWDNASYTSPILSTVQTVCKWDIKIHHVLKYGAIGSYMAMGITSGVITNKQLIHAGEYIYGYAGWNGMKLDSEHRWYGDYGKGYYIGDAISVELDLIKGHVSFYKNGKSQGIQKIHQSPDIQYRLAMSVHEKESKIEIVRFTQTLPLAPDTTLKVMQSRKHQQRIEDAFKPQSD